MPLLNQGPGHLSRRDFLKAAAVTTGAVAFSGCAAGPNAFRVESEPRLAEDNVSAKEAWYATACAECEAGCGIVVRVVEGRARKIEGNPDHPVNQGKLCARGQAALQAEYNPDRLRGPLGRTGARGTLPQSGLTWDEALQTLAQRLDTARGRAAIISRPLDGHQAVLMEQFAGGLGATWLRIESIGEEPFRAAVKRVYGTDTMPDFDLANAGYVLSFGADFLGSWLSPVHYSIAYGRFRQGSYRAGDFHPQSRPRGHLVQIEPRFSGAAAAADEWLPVRPGTEGLVALSLAQALGGSSSIYGSLDQYTPESVARATGVSADRIHRLADDFRSRGPALAIGGGPAGGHTNGADALTAILGLNLIAGNTGKPGGVLFNAGSPWPNVPSRTAPSNLADWTKLVQQLEGGAIDTVLVYDSNPVYELPAALGFAGALGKAGFVASFTSFPDETAEQADLVLPPRLPLEDWGDSLAESLPAVTIRQPIVQPLYDNRSFWDTLLDLGRRLQLPSWPAGTFQEAIRNAARTLPGINSGDFEKSWTELRAKGFWSGPAGASRPSSSASGMAQWSEPQFAGDASSFPYYLQVFPHNSLGDGRAANLPWMQALPDPVTSVVWESWVEVSPKLGFKEGDMARVDTTQGSVDLPVYVNPAAPPDVLSIPLGQGHRAYGRYAQDRGVNPLDLLAPLADTTTGALAYSATRARISPTGRRIQLSKFEGDVPAYQIPGKEVLEVRYGAK
ncbi:MAG TPA: molybdopterin-dependent oxidoreductase [Chloroflexota bacterium]|nr:molybdopterin-dependent oxidoreductase [Chloroflexota bacterium]